MRTEQGLFYNYTVTYRECQSYYIHQFKSSVYLTSKEVARRFRRDMLTQSKRLFKKFGHEISKSWIGKVLNVEMNFVHSPLDHRSWIELKDDNIVCVKCKGSVILRKSIIR